MSIATGNRAGSNAELAPHRAGGAPTNWGRSPIGHGWLILQFALKDFKIRYTHSALGYAWSVLNPLMFFCIYYVVFSKLMHLDIPNYPGFLLLGIALWQFFSEGTANGANAMIARAELIAKTVLPREVVVYAALANAALTFVINLVVLFGLLVVTGTPITMPSICFPLLLIDLFLLTLGMSLFLAPLYVRFRDVGYLWGIALQVGFWVTPIIYLDLMIPPHWRWIVWINPLARIIGDSRRAVIYGQWPATQGLVITTVLSVAICFLGFAAFRKLQGRVVEHL